MGLFDGWSMNNLGYNLNPGNSPLWSGMDSGKLNPAQSSMNTGAGLPWQAGGSSWTNGAGMKWGPGTNLDYDLNPQNSSMNTGAGLPWSKDNKTQNFFNNMDNAFTKGSGMPWAAGNKNSPQDYWNGAMKIGEGALSGYYMGGLAGAVAGGELGLGSAWSDLDTNGAQRQTLEAGQKNMNQENANVASKQAANLTNAQAVEQPSNDLENSIMAAYRRNKGAGNTLAYGA